MRRMRDQLPIVLALIVLGSVSAHLLDGVWGLSEAHGHIEGGIEGHGSSLWPAIIVPLLVGCSAAALRRVSTRLQAGLLVVLPFVAWMAQEATERLRGAESLPFESNPLKHIALGLLVQIPVALFIYLAVRAAIVVAHKLHAAFVQPIARGTDTGGDVGARRGFTPKISVLARGSPTRGPPLLVSI